MFRRKKQRNDNFDINFAPLMDLLTSVVGAMLFVVIFAVVSAQSSKVRMLTPRLQEPPVKSERKVFICTNGMVRLFDWDGGKKKLLDRIAGVGYDDIPGAVAAANRKNTNDGWFHYSLAYDDWSNEDEQYRAITLIAEPVNGAAGETSSDLDRASSKLAHTLDSLDRSKAWITFLVDKNSVDVFQKARALAVKHGYAAGWDPIVEITFPYRECIKSCPGAKDDTAGVARGIQW